jgi:hypothetical protein
MNQGERTMKRTAVLLMALLAGFPLFGQEPAEASSADVTSDYRLGEDGKIRQRIGWTRANAYFYEVEIEKIGPGAVWNLELKERTEQTFLEVSLTPGMYRYRILNYNVLGRVGAVSEWTGIRVFVAKPPAAESFSPAAYFIDSPAGEFTLTVRGRDLAEEAQVVLVAAQDGAKPIPPDSLAYSADGNSLVAVFSAGDLRLGDYEIVITNPGGIRQTLEGFVVGFSSPVDISVSLGCAPVFPVYGYLFDTFDEAFYPLGFYARAGIVPIKRLWGWIGFEVSPRYADLKTKTDAYSLSGRMFGVYANILFQRWNGDYTMALNLRLGGGGAAVTNIKFSNRDGSQSEEVSTTLAAINAGAAVQWFLDMDIFIEAGAEYIQFFSSQSPMPGLIQATAAVGKRF